MAASEKDGLCGYIWLLVSNTDQTPWLLFISAHIYGATTIHDVYIFESGVYFVQRLHGCGYNPQRGTGTLFSGEGSFSSCQVWLLLRERERRLFESSSVLLMTYDISLSIPRVNKVYPKVG